MVSEVLMERVILAVVSLCRMVVAYKEGRIAETWALNVRRGKWNSEEQLAPAAHKQVESRNRFRTLDMASVDSA